MDDELTREYERWRAADNAGLEDEADEACLAVFAATSAEPAVSGDFTARTLTAIAQSGAADAIWSRRTRRAVACVGVAAAATLVYVGGPWLLGAGSWMLVGVINLLVRATVQLATSMETGVDIWAVVAGIGRALAAFVSSPSVTIAMVAMQAIAMAALIALQRLLGSDRESLK